MQEQLTAGEHGAGAVPPGRVARRIPVRMTTIRVSGRLLVSPL